MLFGRLTERAQRVLAHAQEEAIRLNHSNIGTEHLLLGLMKEPEGIAAKVLVSFNITEDKVIEEVENLSVTVKSKWAHYIIHREQKK